MRQHQLFDGKSIFRCPLATLAKLKLVPPYVESNSGKSFWRKRTFTHALTAAKKAHKKKLYAKNHSKLNIFIVHTIHALRNSAQPIKIDHM